jgi:predicted component of type VI protein secretion system
MSRKLLVTDGTRERELQLVGRTVVGRDPACDVSHDHSLLSRRHAEFVTAGELVVVRDLGSRNGVFVNGTKTAEQSLKPGDIVQIGPLRAQYVLDRVPLSIAPDDHDADRTSVRRGAPAAAASKQADAAAAFPSEADEANGDEDATRLIAPPNLEVDSDATRLISSPPTPTPMPISSAAPAPLPFAPAPGPITLPARSAAVIAAPESSRTFFFLQLLLLGVLVLGATTFSFRADAAGPTLKTFLVPVIVLAVGAYLISGILDRRFTALRAQSGRDQR